MENKITIEITPEQYTVKGKVDGIEVDSLWVKTETGSKTRGLGATLFEVFEHLELEEDCDDPYEIMCALNKMQNK